MQYANSSEIQTMFIRHSELINLNIIERNIMHLLLHHELFAQHISGLKGHIGRHCTQKPSPGFKRQKKYIAINPSLCVHKINYQEIYVTKKQENPS